MQSDSIKTQIGGLVLHEDRVVHDAGYECFEVALLEDVDGVRVLHRHYPRWLLAGVLLGVAVKWAGVAGRELHDRIEGSRSWVSDKGGRPECLRVWLGQRAGRECQ